MGKGYIRAQTDDQGRYRLEGAPVGQNELLAISPLDQPYLLSKTKADTSADGDSLEIDFRLKRGVWIQGRITDKATGEGMPARVEYFAFTDNPHAKEAPGYSGAHLQMRYMAGANGRYRLPGLPGRGIVGVMIDDGEKYERGMGADQIKGADAAFGGTHQTFRTYPYLCHAFNFHALAEVNPPEGAERVARNFALDSGRTLSGTVVDPDGQPVDSGWYTGKTAFESWRPLENGRFTVHSYRPDQPRLVQIVTQDRNLAGHLVLSGERRGEIVVKLEPAGTLKGRVVVDGVPKTDCEIISSRPPAPSPDKMERNHETGRGHLPPDGLRSIGTASTDENGDFEIAGIPGGSGLPWTPLRRAVSDSEGAFRLSVSRSEANRGGKPVTALSVVATAKGYGADWRGIRLGDADRSQEIELRLAPDVPVRGRILNTDGR